MPAVCNFMPGLLRLLAELLDLLHDLTALAQECGNIQVFLLEVRHHRVAHRVERDHFGSGMTQRNLRRFRHSWLIRHQVGGRKRRHCRLHRAPRIGKIHGVVVRSCERVSNFRLALTRGSSRVSAVNRGSLTRAGAGRVRSTTRS